MKIEDVFKKLKPIAGKDLDRIWLEYILADSSTQKAVEDALKVTLAQSLNSTYEERELLLEPPPPDVSSAEYPLGVAHYGRQPLHLFGIREEEWIRHVGIFGITGSGKTNLSFLTVLNFLKKDKKFLIFDWKRNYRDLLSLPLEKNILVFTVGRDVTPFFFNPLIPPKGTPPTVWLKKLIEITCHAYFLGEGVAYLLQKAIDSVYREFGVYEGTPEAYPTIRDVKEWLEKHRVKGREGSWMESALRAMGVLCYGEVGKVLNARQPFPLEEILERNVILELDALTNADKTFLIESLLLWIHHYRMAQEQRERFKHAIVIEEAHHILLRKKQEVTGEEAVTDVILREIRELGEGIILIDQNPSLISKPALGNTYCTIAMNLKHRGDVQMIADCIMLDSKTARFLGKLDVGMAVVKLQGRWHEPFLARFPIVRLKKGVITDRIVKERMARFYGKHSELIMAGNGDYRRGESERKSYRSYSGGEKRENKEKEAILTTNERLLLEDIEKNKISPTTERYMRLGLNAYQGNKAKEGLAKKKMIDVERINKENGRVKILVRKEGWKEDERKEKGVNKNGRKGGTEHEYWKQRLKSKLLGSGYEVVEEYPIGNGKTVDLVATKDGRKLAIEMETGNSDALANIRKALNAGFDLIVTFATNRQTYDDISRTLQELDSNGRKVVVLSPQRLHMLTEMM